MTPPHLMTPAQLIEHLRTLDDAAIRAADLLEDARAFVLRLQEAKVLEWGSWPADVNSLARRLR